MFYLIWEMGILLLLAVGFGVFVGYQIWSGDARSAEADAALAENARLRQENENLARRLGEAKSSSRVVAEPVAARAEAPEIAMPEPVEAAADITRPGDTRSTGDIEPVAKPKAKAKAKAATASNTAKSQPAATSDAGLSDIKGLGPKAAAALKAGGVTSVSQIASWTDADIARWDEAINGRGRIVRDDWVGQAKSLSGG
ncbi:hypothetical protein AWH62_03035 [Maricaulis sp. W15]|uniref:hypothetical protein n=1 Tax=Maricaulis sp. W15 TaxID=1772333 RepID=UPI000948B91F|nr:hypothetical protein [Maricaulis sp. W15]OLF77663.1 hypothetical protein AWH62_03035 [Maricaulis sp. W15]